jgi:hypothetical protein
MKYKIIFKNGIQIQIEIDNSMSLANIIKIAVGNFLSINGSFINMSEVCAIIEMEKGE